MAVYGYLRVSTKSQDSDYQRSQILEYTNDLKLGTVEFTNDIVSGAKDWRKREIYTLIEKMTDGDILLVNEFSRLGRSLLDILDILKTLKEKNCQVHIVRDRMVIGDDISSKLMVFMFGLVSEIERDLIKSRVTEGVKNHREKNLTKAWGRPKGSQYASRLDEKRGYIIELLDKGISKTSIAKMLEVNYQTLNSYIKTRGLVATSASVA
ncbi:MAG: recombinase family protein [Sulfuricurvum sp.]|nr:recombinase family protein [Sulfuricurvum sp.]